jgi:hypothetical protein
MRRAIASRRRLVDALIIVLAVVLLIGSPALPQRLPGDVASASPVCDSFATGGNAQVLELQGVEYCLHVFSQIAPAAFVAVDPRITQVAYLIVGGGVRGRSAHEWARRSPARRVHHLHVRAGLPRGR